MKNLFARFINNESGATAIEYAVIGGVMAVLVIGGATTLGNNLSSTFKSMGTKITLK